MRNLSNQEIMFVNGAASEAKEIHAGAISSVGGMLGGVIGGVLGYTTIASNPIAAVPVIHVALNTAIGYVSGAIIGGVAGLHARFVS